MVGHGVRVRRAALDDEAIRLLVADLGRCQDSDLIPGCPLIHRSAAQLVAQPLKLLARHRRCGE